MDMQDKEFDELFHSKLNDLEMTPSPDVWAGVAAGIDGGKRKKTLMPIWGIAASIIVLLAAGILFNPKKRAVGIKPSNNSIAKTKAAVISRTAVINGPATKTVIIAATGSMAVVSKKIADQQNDQQPSVVHGGRDKTSTSAGSDSAPILTEVQRPGEQLVAIVSDTGTKLFIKGTDDDQPVFANRPPIALAQLPDVDRHAAAAVRPARKIHTLGDLINLAVSKVDKRQDKVIEFTDNDDSGSSITAVNLGILKLKKDNSK